MLEGIALVADPEFQIIQAAYPFISRKLLTDQSPRLKAALHYMVSPFASFIRPKDSAHSGGLCLHCCASS